MYRIIAYYQENNQKTTDYKLQSRYLWNDHISYTRNAIISILSGLEDVDAVSQRLIKNQEDIGVFMSLYYTTEQVSGFVDLLKQHIVIATNVIKGVEGSEEQWRMNGKDIVNYLFSINKMFWSISVLWPLWNDHMNYTIAQVNARKSSMWDDDIVAYDDNHACISEFADIFSNGIIYQHMEAFSFHLEGV